MKKKKSGGGGANWMDTYGDMVTLLLCFFVLLYSMSTISEENWKAIVMSFNPSGVPTNTIVSGGDGPSADADEQGGLMDIPEPEMSQQDIDDQIEELFQALQAYAAQSSAAESISVTKDGGRIFVTFQDTAFFDPERPELREDALPILDAMGGMLSDAAAAIDEVRVQGHTAQGTPDRPNNTRTDRMLSSNRATNVVIYIQDHTDPDVLDPAKLISEGFGQWHPVETNDTSEGRAANRRVEMVISGRDLESEMSEGIKNYTTESYTAEPLDSTTT